MFAAILATLTLLVGLVLGWKGREIHDKVAGLYDLWKDRIEAPAGVVTLEKRRVTRYQPPDPDSEAGGVMRPRPHKVLDDDENIARNIQQQNRNLR
jgi:hypothetical protein